ncbi:phytanoyl-CoA dioxygenase family protein [Bauldia sp.]|uniref:phytanoyl-CoA dioxygenase family protein n=1 Tax=Bauldia sp. TaxID=2575872 RepID=UPI003BAA81E7
MKLLTVDQMVDFVRNGFLRFDAVVPASVNAAFMDRYARDLVDENDANRRLPAVRFDTPIGEAFAPDTPIDAMLRLPEVAGALHSLLGPGALVDHQRLHYREPGQHVSQFLHCDAMIDARRDAFDVQLMYYPHDVTREMGGTLIVPGSHLRRVNQATIARYQNVRGQTQLVGPAGTVLILHHNIWHAGRRNASDTPRAMYKLRFNPTVRQTGHWDMSTYDAEAARAAKPLHSPHGAEDDIQHRLSTWEPWADVRGGYLDVVQRTKLWRLLAGDDDFTVHHWLTRVENVPGEARLDG